MGVVEVATARGTDKVVEVATARGMARQCRAVLSARKI